MNNKQDNHNTLTAKDSGELSIHDEDTETIYISVDEEFAVTTSLHGIIRVVRVQSVIGKIIWCCVIAMAFIICGYQITDRVKTYFDFPTNTEVTTEYENSLAFPAVTICNYNRYQKNYITGLDKQFLKIAGDVLHLLDDTARGGDKHLRQTMTAEQRQDYVKKIEVNITKLYSGGFNFSEFTIRSGFQLNNTTLRHCDFGGKSCDTNDFVRISTAYGNCYTFNQLLQSSENTRVQEMPGSENGLRLVLDIQQHEYTERLPTGNIEIGIKFLVHAPYEVPRIASSGVAVSPGLHGYAAIKYEQNIYMKHPHGKCDPNSKLLYFKNYTMAGCIMECKLKYIRNVCKCRTLYLPDDRVTPLCNITDMSGCFYNQSRYFQTKFKTLCSNCTIPCFEESYPTSLSYAQLSRNMIGEDLAKQFNVDLQYLSNNFIFLDVFYEELAYQRSEQTAAIVLSSLISDIGGQFGLFLGMSILTFGEIIEYLLLKFWNFVKERRSVKIEPKDTEKDEIPKVAHIRVVKKCSSMMLPNMRKQISISNMRKQLSRPTLSKQISVLPTSYKF